MSTSILFFIPAILAAVAAAPPEPSSEVSSGYILFTPLASTSTYFIDNETNIVNQWESSYRAGGAAYLINTNHLIRAGSTTARDSTFSSGGGVGGIIEEYDYAGSLVWDFSYAGDSYVLHHDFKELPDGNIIALSWNLRTYNGNDYWDEKIIAIDKNTEEIIWEWSAMDHDILPTAAQADYIHLNSIDYKDGKILVSSRSLNQLWIIDKASGAIETKYSGDLIGQHDASFLDNGNILVFNNSTVTSSVEEINLATSSVLWSYEDTFYSDHISGAQRLENGNTLICSGEDGEFFEVTTDGEVVWTYTNPYSQTTPGGEINSVFKIRKYDIEI